MDKAATTVVLEAGETLEVAYRAPGTIPFQRTRFTKAAAYNAWRRFSAADYEVRVWIEGQP